jgi:Na+-transporting methylmalonyl-CoA/oxaloacetate decarboxylase gamma subunit
MLLIMYDVVDAMLAGGVAAVLPFMILMMPCMDGVGASSQRIFSSVSKSDTNMQYQRRIEKQQ